jgi:hypothetical protein
MKSKLWQSLGSACHKWVISVDQSLQADLNYATSAMAMISADSRQSLSSLCELCLTQSPSLKLAGFALHTVRALTLHVLLPEVAVLLREGLTV